MQYGNILLIQSAGKVGILDPCYDIDIHYILYNIYAESPKVRHLLHLKERVIRSSIRELIPGLLKYKDKSVCHSSQVKSSQIKSSQVKSSQDKSSQVKSSQVKSSQDKSSQVR